MSIGRTAVIVRLVLALVFGLALVMPAVARNVTIVIVTEILPKDPVSGMKSTHRIFIDTASWQAKDSYETGTTYGVPSADDRFSVGVQVKPDDTRAFVFRGSTETGVGLGFAPAINYTIYLDFDLEGNMTLSGTHDGYPAYSVAVNRKLVYRFEHEKIDLIKLMGEEDVRIPVTRIAE